MRSIHSIKLELLLDPRIRIRQVNSIELKFDPTITLIVLPCVTFYVFYNLFKSCFINCIFVLNY